MVLRPAGDSRSRAEESCCLWLVRFGRCDGFWVQSGGFDGKGRGEWGVYIWLGFGGGEYGGCVAEAWTCIDSGNAFTSVLSANGGGIDGECDRGLYCSRDVVWEEDLGGSSRWARIRKDDNSFECG